MNTDKMKCGTEQKPMTNDTFAMKTIADFSKKVTNENHGIKAKNIKELYAPLGYDIDCFNQDFLNELDTFGEIRGVIAHTSSLKAKKN